MVIPTMLLLAAAPLSLEELHEAVVATLTPCEAGDDACVEAGKRVSKGTRISVALTKAQLEQGKQVLLQRELAPPRMPCDVEWSGRGLIHSPGLLIVNAAASKVRVEAPQVIAVFEITAVTRKSTDDAEMKREKRHQLVAIDGELSQAQVSLSGVTKDVLEEIAPQLETARAARTCVAAFSPAVLKVTIETRLVSAAP